MAAPDRRQHHPDVGKMRRAVGRLPSQTLFRLGFCWWDSYDDCRAVMEVAGLVEPEKRLPKRWQKPRAQAGARRKKALPKRKAKRKRGQRKHPETHFQVRRRILQACRTLALARMERRQNDAAVCDR